MKYRKEVDGLRAVAVVPVILFHAGWSVFSGGYVGVDVFFVISGFLITSIIVEEKQAGRFTIKGFYERRARRILPALFLVILACLIPAWLWMLPDQLEHFSKSVFSVALFASNFYFWRTMQYFQSTADQSPLLHTWSLAVEEQFYVLFPLFLVLTWRFGRRCQMALIFLIGIASLALCQYAAFAYGNANFFLAPTRAWELMIGSFAAFATLRQPLYERTGAMLNELLAGAGLAMIAYAVFAFDGKTPFPSVYALVPTVGTVAIILFGTPRTLVGRILASPICVGIGLLSYSAYLWHQPLFAFATIRSFDEPGPWLMGVLGVVAFVLAYLTWRYVEKPFRNRRNFSTRQVFGMAGTAMASLILLGAVGYYGEGFKSRFPANALAALSVIGQKQAWYGKGCNNVVDRKPLSELCILGDKKAPPTVALWGDSHAEALSKEFTEATRPLGISFVQMTADACPPVEGLRTTGTRRLFGQVDCAPVAKNAHDYLLRHNTVHTLVLAARWTAYLLGARFDNGEGGVSDDGFYAVPVGEDDDEIQSERIKRVSAAIIKEVRSLLDAGKKVILVYPVPEVGWSVPHLLARMETAQGKKHDTISTNYARERKRNAIAVAALDAIGHHPNLIRVRPARILCNTFIKNRCVAAVDGVPFYLDHNHLIAAGAKLVVDKIITHLRGSAEPRSAGTIKARRSETDPTEEEQVSR